MNKVITILLSCLLCLSNAIHAQSGKLTVDSIIQRYYNPEKGYFQKAGYDKSNPRFMLENEDGSFKFGIGGFVNVLSQLDFGGIENMDFITSQIKIPTNNDPKFLISPYQTRFNFKVVGKDAKKRDIVAFVEAGYNGTSIALRHAYVSYAGFTLGQTWTTFMDLESNLTLIDGEGPNNQIGIRAPMIRYTHNFNKLELSLAIEIGDHLFEFAEKHNFIPQNQIVPNIPMHIKYKWKWGYSQLGAVFKTMNYGDDTANLNKSVYVPGYGLSWSGGVDAWKNGRIFYQFVGGKGIGNYINDLSSFNYDLIPVQDEHGAFSMTTLQMYGGYLGLQHDWTTKLSSNIVYGHTWMVEPVLPHRYRDVFTYNNLYKSANYFAVNLLWDFIPFGRVGIEYLFGTKTNLAREKGADHRINLSMRYDF